nr:hypothetical protein [Tanacetum cinerariifolium]
EARIQLNAKQADWRDDTDDEFEDQELEARYIYMAQIQEVTPDAANNSGHIFDAEPSQKVSNDYNYNVFAIESEHPEQSKSVHDTYPIEKDEHNVITDSLDMSYDREQIDQDDDDDDLANEQEDAEEEEQDPEEDPKEDPEEEPEDDDDDMEMDDEAKTPPTSPVIPDADGQPIPPIALFGQNFHFGSTLKMDRTMKNVMLDLSELKKLVKGLSDQFDKYERSKVFDAKRVLEKELVNERNAKEFYREFVREPPVEPSARPVPAPYPDDPYVVTRDAAIADAAIATSSIDDDDDDDTAPMDSQPHEPCGSPRDTQ